MERLLEHLDRVLGHEAGSPATAEEGVNYWRRRVLDVAMAVGLVLGTISVIPGIARAAMEGNLVLLVADVAVLAVAAFVLMARGVSYSIRAGLLVAAAFGIGMVQIVTSGLHTPGPLWLFAGPVLAAILFDLRVALPLVGVVVVTFVAQLGLDAAGWLPASLALEVGSPRWVEVATDLVLLATVVSLFMAVLLQGLKSSFERIRRVSDDLAGERQRLLRTNEELETEIGRRRRAEEERAHMAAAMEQARKMEAIGTFAGGIAHDFNNLLVPILGTAELMRSEVEDDAHELLDDITRSARRGKELVAQILAFSRGGEQRRGTVHLAAVVEDSERLLRASLPPKIEFDLALLDSAPVHASDTEVQQVLMNLCTNAFHAMNGEGGTLRVTVDRVAGAAVDTRNAVVAAPPDPSGQYARLTVADTGAGMPEETLGRVFEPFFTTKPQGEGTGLGLTMVHGVTRGMGGTVVIHSREGAGTTVEVLLPRSAEPVAGTSEPGPTPRGSGQRVLVVDDEAPVRAVIVRFLERLGYLPEPVAAEHAGRILKSDEPVDLLITDLSMPGIDGFELGRLAHHARPGLPMILVTGLADQETLESADRAGFSHVLAKPFDMAELSEAVAAVVDPQSSTG